jgi:hypothetical protein
VRLAVDSPRERQFYCEDVNAEIRRRHAGGETIPQLAELTGIPLGQVKSGVAATARRARQAPGSFRLLEVCTGVCTRCTFVAFPAHLTHATMRVSCSHAVESGPGRSRTSARGFEVRRSIH